MISNFFTMELESSAQRTAVSKGISLGLCMFHVWNSHVIYSASCRGMSSSPSLFYTHTVLDISFVRVCGLFAFPEEMCQNQKTLEYASLEIKMKLNVYWLRKRKLARNKSSSQSGKMCCKEMSKIRKQNSYLITSFRKSL